MKIREISFHKNFKCTASECSENCCHGWQIPLNNEDFVRFSNERGVLGLKLSAYSIIGTNYVFNPNSKTCPFRNKDMLCTLQIKKGHDFIPQACRDYPRFYRNYREFEERYIDLSCLHGAEMFLSEFENMHLIEYEDEAGSKPCGTNDDADFLYALDGTRKMMIQALYEVKDLNALTDTLNRMKRYAELAQEAFIKGDTGYLTEKIFDAFAFCMNTDTSSKDFRLFPFSAEIFDKLMHTSFYSDRLKTTQNTLYKLCRLYYDKYAHILYNEDKWENTARELLSKYPHLLGHLAAYLIYYLYQYYFKTYEDYSFRRNILMGIIHMNMVFMLEVIYENEHKSLTSSEKARLISVYNRRAFFSELIMDDMYKCL